MLQGASPTMGDKSAAVYAANNEPDEDPPGAEECDDTMQEVVGAITLHVRSTLDNLL